MELLVVIFIVVILIGGLIGLRGCGSGIRYSTGTRTGVIYKLSTDKGMVWKTVEGELSLNLTTRNEEGALVNQTFAFSLRKTPGNAELIKDLEHFANTGEKCTIGYKQYLFRGPSYGSTGYEVVSVKPSNPAPQSPESE